MDKSNYSLTTTSRAAKPRSKKLRDTASLSKSEIVNEVLGETTYQGNNVISSAMILKYADEKGASAAIDAKYQGADGLVKNAYIKAIAEEGYSAIELGAQQIKFSAEHKLSLDADVIELNANSVMINGQESVGSLLSAGATGELYVADGTPLRFVNGILYSGV